MNIDDIVLSQPCGLQWAFRLENIEATFILSFFLIDTISPKLILDNKLVSCLCFTIYHLSRLFNAKSILYK